MKRWSQGVSHRIPTNPDGPVIDPVKQLAARPLGVSVRATPAEMKAAVGTVLRNARDNGDARILLDILGLVEL